MTMYPEIHTLAGATLHWSGVGAQGTPNATIVHHIILDPSHQKWNPRSTMGPLRMITELVQAWDDLHNLIGGWKSISHTKCVLCVWCQHKIFFTGVNVYGLLICITLADIGFLGKDYMTECCFQLGRWWAEVSVPDAGTTAEIPPPAADSCALSSTHW
jgi:hypothetical protein